MHRATCSWQGHSFDSAIINPEPSCSSRPRRPLVFFGVSLVVFDCVGEVAWRVSGGV